MIVGRVHGEVEAHDFDRAGLEVVGSGKPDIGDAPFEIGRPAGGGDVTDLLAVARDGPADKRLGRLAGDAVDPRAPVGHGRFFRASRPKKSDLARSTKGPRPAAHADIV